MNIKNKIRIEKLDDRGRGIGYLNNKIIFIPNTLVGEEVVVNITKETSKYYEGEVIEYISKSNKRIEVKCPYYDLCGGCSLMHMSYEDSIDYKYNKLKNILKKFSNIDECIEVIENKNIFNYRNKIELKINNKEWGYYNSKTHNFIKIDKCLLAKDSINKVLDYKELFDITNGNITIRSNYNDEIIIVINSDDKININVDKLRSIIKLVGIVINDKIYYGQNYFIEKYKDLYFKVNYNSFFQINEYITNKMIDILNENISGENLLDLYCGVGFLGLSVHNNFNSIYGIEINENSILDAVYNSSLNNINNTYFMCGSSSNIIEKIKNNIDTIIVDPPRTGLFGNTINDILEINANKLVYVSCNPVTLARDLNVLKSHYDIKKIYLLDMFSNTFHFETIVIMKKRNLIRKAVRTFLIKDDKVLCIEYKKNNIGYIDLPGGKIEENETSIDAAIREFKEETGIVINDLEYIGNVNIEYPNIIFDIEVFLAKSYKGIPQENSEFKSYWIPIKELLNKEKRFAITYLLEDKYKNNFYNKKINIKFNVSDNHNIIFKEEKIGILNFINKGLYDK